VIQLSGLVTLLVLGIFLILWFRGEHYSLPSGRA